MFGMYIKHLEYNYFQHKQTIFSYSDMKCFYEQHSVTLFSLDLTVHFFNSEATSVCPFIHKQSSSGHTEIRPPRSFRPMCRLGYSRTGLASTFCFPFATTLTQGCIYRVVVPGFMKQYFTTLKYIPLQYSPAKDNFLPYLCHWGSEGLYYPSSNLVHLALIFKTLQKQNSAQKHAYN